MRDNLQSLKVNAQHIYLIIDTLHKIQKGDEETISAVDVKTFFKDILPLLFIEIEQELQREVKIEYDIQDNLPPIKGNPTLFKQVFINLYKNACEAMSGVVKKEIKIKVYLKEDDKDNVYIEFKDTGRGIPQHILPNLFTRGFTTKGKRGSGIGLYQSKIIIERLGGSIDVYSQEGQGTSFVIKLPVYK